MKTAHLLVPFLMLAGCTQPASIAVPPATAAAAAPGSVVAARGAVSAAHPLAAEAGREMLARGGSAADAALATMLVLTIVEPQSSGIGGGGFLLYHDAETGRLSTIDGRETAPASATPSMFLDAAGQPKPFSEVVRGGLSVGVPGNLRLAEHAHAKFGKLPWATVFAPAIRIARDGFAVTPRLHNFLVQRRAFLAGSPAAQALFYEADGSAKPTGSIVRNPALASLLEQLATRGADAFYSGEPAANLVAAVTTAPTNPSGMTVADVANYHVKERPPVCGQYRVYRICGMAPPSSGGITVFAILKQLEGHDLAALGPANVEAWHLIAESMRLAYADREAYIADPGFVTVPTDGLVDPAYLASRGRLISRDRAQPIVTAGTPTGAPQLAMAPDPEVGGTSHFVAADAAGDVASYTSTIESVFGSGLVVDGYVTNNELTDFNFVPKVAGKPVANSIAPGKRPRSSMSPTIVYGPDGKVLVAIGAAGGPTIIAQVAKALIGVLDWKLPVQEAIALPQIVAIGNRVRVEQGTSLEAMAPQLRAYGHNIEIVPLPLKANAVERVGNGWRGAADPRGEGRAVGVE